MYRNDWKLKINVLKSKLQYSNLFRNASMPNKGLSSNSAKPRHNFDFLPHFNSKTTEPIFTKLLHDVESF